MKTALQLIAEECIRVRDNEGYTDKHDDSHTNGEIALAAACYATPSNKRIYIGGALLQWPWHLSSWKPSKDPWGFGVRVGDGRIRELVKAGALIVAEIGRLQRLNNPELMKGEK